VFALAEGIGTTATTDTSAARHVVNRADTFSGLVRAVPTAADRLDRR